MTTIRPTLPDPFCQNWPLRKDDAATGSMHRRAGMAGPIPPPCQVGAAEHKPGRPRGIDKRQKKRPFDHQGPDQHRILPFARRGRHDKMRENRLVRTDAGTVRAVPDQLAPAMPCEYAKNGLQGLTAAHRRRWRHPCPEHRADPVP